MRRGRRLVVLVAVLLSITGATPAWVLAQETPARGGTLVVAISADPGHLNPAITTSGATHTAAELLYNGLLGRDERGDAVPDLAESWTIEQAGAVYRFLQREALSTTALSDVAPWVLGVTVLAQVVALVSRSEAWHLTIGAAGGTVDRRTLYRASSMQVLGGVLNGHLGVAARIAALRRSSPDVCPQVPTLIAAEFPILAV